VAIVAAAAFGARTWLVLHRNDPASYLAGVDVFAVTNFPEPSTATHSVGRELALKAKLNRTSRHGCAGLRPSGVSSASHNHHRTVSLGLYQVRSLGRLDRAFERQIDRDRLSDPAVVAAAPVLPTSKPEMNLGHVEEAYDVDLS
jgi:hypothetical protein